MLPCPKEGAAGVVEDFSIINKRARFVKDGDLSRVFFIVFL